jgi:hypothetical protein
MALTLVVMTERSHAVMIEWSNAVMIEWSNAVMIEWSNAVKMSPCAVTYVSFVRPHLYCCFVR